MSEREERTGQGPATPWGFVRLVRPAVAALDGVARLGGPRRWWLLGGHAPGVTALFDDDGRLHFDVCVMCEPGTDARALGMRIQTTVLQEVARNATMDVEAVDVFITPKA
jgi:uncharacterized alkaline shock family protein YloU